MNSIQDMYGTLRTDLDSKFSFIFHNYGLELNSIQDMYEKCKNQPPLSRNMPSVAGNIAWARHLLKRIRNLMQQFHGDQQAFDGSRDARRITRTYNKMAKTLVEFEVVWYSAWTASVEQARSGLQATLIVRHLEDGKYYVNFDWEILQLMRETRCLDRMGGIEIPEAAKMTVLQEDKLKTYYNELTHMLREHHRVTTRVKPIVANLLKSHLEHIELKMRPGMISLTWTSLYIDGCIRNVWTELGRLDQLFATVHDLVENRINASLKVVSHVLLVDTPQETHLVSLDDFVEILERNQRRRRSRAQVLQDDRGLGHGHDPAERAADPDPEPAACEGHLRAGHLLRPRGAGQGDPEGRAAAHGQHPDGAERVRQLP